MRTSEPTGQGLAIRRGMEFIYGLARHRKHFAECGDDLLYFYSRVAKTSRDRGLRRMARAMAGERLPRWRHDRRSLPPDSDADAVLEYFYEAFTAEHLGIRDGALKRQLREAAGRFTAAEFLWFDPHAGPPPTDVPAACDRCGGWNERGRKACRWCRRRLTMMTRYEVWYYSLTRAYCAETYGITLGARYADVLRWLPALRPYPAGGGTNPDFSDAVYAVSHLVYTLNDYGVYRLPPRWLPEEYEFLKANLKEAVALDDADMMGEFLDSLMAFGLTGRHPLIRLGQDFLLSRQNPDGSWGEMGAEDLYARYHPTWAAIDGLREYRWRGVGLRFPELKPLLLRWAREGGGGREAAKGLPGNGRARRRGCDARR